METLRRGNDCVIKSERIVYTRCIVFGYFLEIPIKVNCCYFWWSSSPLGKVWTDGEENRRYRNSFKFMTCWLVSDFWTASLKLKVKFYRCFHFYTELILRLIINVIRTFHKHWNSHIVLNVAHNIDGCNVLNLLNIKLIINAIIIYFENNSFTILTKDL